MTQPSMSEGELAKMKELRELAKITEHQMKELADFTLEINQKYKKSLAEIRVANKLQSRGME
ncbi:hypothetical protein H6S82_27750 [Planktothrix sp. FACHB-1355]|uniref:Uncharacterized protein n=1 Tax=Aerosakkonema funiforme FACHB-1375 TaxID=2949571 RepID=A0A926VGJ4_9CYAN|nr:MULTISPECIES: hypothetical protein [Oscillatoriales]MBD2183328.1 hypothetical protein [Aerosakkonema funiforme FACHB-1375]MBD3562610.1 hypothetical protein [Planktothrix sp. FACHB-1355]